MLLSVAAQLRAPSSKTTGVIIQPMESGARKRRRDDTDSHSDSSMDVASPPPQQQPAPIAEPVVVAAPHHAELPHAPEPAGTFVAPPARPATMFCQSS